MTTQSFENSPALTASTSALRERRVTRSVIAKLCVSTGRLLIVDPHTELDRDPLGIALPAGLHDLVVFSARSTPALAQIVVRDRETSTWECVETAFVDSGLLAILDDASRQGLRDLAGDDDEASLYDFFEDTLASHEGERAFVFAPEFDTTQTIALFRVDDGTYPLWVGRDADEAVTSVVVGDGAGHGEPRGTRRRVHWRSTIAACDWRPSRGARLRGWSAGDRRRWRLSLGWLVLRRRRGDLARAR